MKKFEKIVTWIQEEVRTGKMGYAAKSVNDSVLDNQNPNSFWNAMGYNVK